MAGIRSALSKIGAKLAGIYHQMEPAEFVVRKQKEGSVKPNIISYYDPKSIIAEEYRTIRTNLQFALSGNDKKRFLVTSSVHTEGKTVTSTNLASIFAQDTKKTVLLVDCDLRKPSVHRYLSLEMEHGITDYLEHDIPLPQLIKNTEIPNLDIITCGTIPENPSELLGCERMDQFIADAEELYDYVIYDTPPIIPVTDAAVLGPKMQGAVLLIKAGDTQRETVKHAYRLFQQADTKILGFVLTGAQQYIPKYLYRYQYYHYYHYKK